MPLEPQGRLGVLELFHGPTAAFKDFGARFLAACMSRLRTPGQRPLNILVATSGDTGGAVAAAFHRLPGVEVSVLYPKGLVSPTQEHQLTCWGENVKSFAVRGTFDDCQRMVKAAFMDARLNARFDLSSANSINLGRLLPQAVYYAASSLQGWSEHGRAGFIRGAQRQRGQFRGRAVGAAHGYAHRRIWSWPTTSIARYRTCWRPEHLCRGQASPRWPRAMDVGNPSNLERLRWLYPDPAQLRAAISADVVTDDEIRARIRAGFQEYGQVWCPHTATAAEVYSRLNPARRQNGRWVVVATAHPAKFREIVEPLIGRTWRCPQSLARLFEFAVAGGGNCRRP